MVYRIITTKNLREKVYELVRDHIVSKEVAPGSKINEETLATNLGVSKTPVREALSKLAHEGLVEIVPNRGSFKVKLTKEDIHEVMLIRETLEGLCIRLATHHVNERVLERLKTILDEFEGKDLQKDFTLYAGAHLKFHSLIYQTSKSPRLTRMIQAVRDLTHMLGLEHFSNPEGVKRSLKSHRELIDAMARRDEVLAEKIRRGIVRSAFEPLLETASEEKGSQSI